MDGEMLSDESVKSFVRNTLGCDCAEEVFRHIENERGVEAGGVALRNKINVGNRLLVYVVQADSPDILARLPAMIKAGKNERDSRGFNRFRLVLVSEDKHIRKAAYETFKSLPEADEKVHLHAIENDRVRGL